MYQYEYQRENLRFNKLFHAAMYNISSLIMRKLKFIRVAILKLWLMLVVVMDSPFT